MIRRDDREVKAEVFALDEISPGKRPKPILCSRGQSKPAAINTTPKMISQRLIARC